MVCTGCCATLDNIVTYLFKRLTRKQNKATASEPQESQTFLRILELHPEILQQVSNHCIQINKLEEVEQFRLMWPLLFPLFI